MDLGTDYLGLGLRNPIIASASPLTGDVNAIRLLEDSGAGAVVLPSLFEEQIRREELQAEMLTSIGAESSPEANPIFLRVSPTTRDRTVTSNPSPGPATPARSA